MWRDSGGWQGSFPPPGVQRVFAHLFCAGLSVSMLFYRTEFSFNESAWGSHCPMSLRNLTLAYNKICLTFSQRRILQFQLERHQWSCLAVLSKSKRKRRSIGRDFMGSGS